MNTEKHIPNNVKYRMFNDSSFNDCHICFCGRENCLPLHSYGPAVRPVYLIHYVLTGKGKFICKNREYSLFAGQAFLIKPDIMTFYQADKDEPWTYIWLGLAGDNLEKFFNRIGLSENNPIAAYENTSAVEKLFQEILKTNSGGIKQEFLREAIVYEFLSLLADNCLVSPIVSEPDELRKNDYLVNAIEFIHNNYFNKIGVSDVAEHVGISRNYLFSIFKESMGHSPSEYITYYKLSSACNMLDTFNYSIENVAEYCGYENPNVFTKAFKRQYGIVPTVYRKLKSNRTDLSPIEFMRYIKKLGK